MSSLPDTAFSVPSLPSGDRPYKPKTHRHRRSQAVSYDLSAIADVNPKPEVKRPHSVGSPTFAAPSILPADETKRLPNKVQFSPVIETIPRFQQQQKAQEEQPAEKEEVTTRGKGHERMRSLVSFFQHKREKRTYYRPPTPPPNGPRVEPPAPLIDLSVLEHLPQSEQGRKHKRGNSCPEFLQPAFQYTINAMSGGKRRRLDPLLESLDVETPSAPRPRTPSLARSSTSTLCSDQNPASQHFFPSPVSSSSSDWGGVVVDEPQLNQLPHKRTYKDIGDPGPGISHFPYPPSSPNSTPGRSKLGLGQKWRKIFSFPK